MMLIQTCARGVRGHAPPKKKMEKMVHSECSEVCYYQPKNQQFFRIINQQPKFFALFFSKFNPDGHVSTKINTFTFYKGGLGGNSPTTPKKCKIEMEASPFLHQILHIRCVDSPVMMCLEVPGSTPWFFLSKWYSLAHFECSKIHYYEPKNRQI